MTKSSYKTGSTLARYGGAWTTYLGSAHGVLTAAQMTDLSLTEMAGMTGMAFQLYMHKHCDAASVTVYDWVSRHLNVLDRIGILSEVYHYEPGTRTYEAARKHAVTNIQASIDRGVGVVAWAIDGGEFGIIHGYDDEDGVYLVDGVAKFNRAFGSDPVLYENIGLTFPPAPFLHYQIPIASVAYNREQTYVDSLKFYVHEMEKQYHMSPDFHSGFLAYDNWIHALSSASYNAFGLRYSTSVYAEAKMWAAEYVRLLANSWGEMPRLSDIADRFEEIAKLYSKMMLDILAQDWDGAKHLGKPVTTEQANQLIPCLKKAKVLEAEAVCILKEAL
ncbi:hypothetical protein [Paenibacillus spongiae]|uniref:DUF4872 domain-containing protein n=1 Tax=Paenibacillus spongiae TaxID=2909671 RepID=A0ABY5S9J9_9BACL|nr:hypothetical protein [Paenibacillus spongiae]UVI29470.1 hypothetical protein L1F29_29305 [Paenibacillus spongiae]